MAATTGQGRSFATFIVGLTVACAGIAYFSSGSGKLLALVGAALLAASFLWFMKIKPQEGKPAQIGGSGGMKLLGAFVACFGWILTIFGLHIVAGTSGRIILSLVGIGFSLFGMIVILPSAYNKHAIWKA
jgi:hypothetical protein